MKTKTKIMSLMMLGASFMLNSVLVNAQNTSPFWSLAGNSNATASSKLGTTTNIPLRLFSNNVERVRIIGSGNVGIGITAPTAKLHVNGTTKLAGLTTITGNATVSGNVGVGTTAPFYQMHVKSTSDGVIAVDGATASSSWNYFLINGGFKAAIGYRASNDAVNIFAAGGDRLSVSNATGFVGINNTAPHAALQFDNSIVNRKIILWENADNDHQYYGFGINGGTLRYQVDATGANHIFFAATSATTSNELVRFTGTGLVGINQASPSRHLEVRHNTGFNSDGFRLLNDFASVNYWDQYVYTGQEQLAFSSNGVERTYINGTTGAVTQASDERLKNNIKPAGMMLDNLMKLDVKSYTYIKNNPANRSSTGIMAQQLNKYFPEFVYAIDRSKDGGNADGSDNTFSVDYAGLSVVAIKAIQELNQKLIAENEVLKNRIDAMESCVTSLCEAREQNSTTQGYSLEQNSPNPFSSETIIHYYLPSNSTAVLKVMSLDGQEMLSTPVTKSGYGEVRISGSTMAAGTYTYTLIVNGKAVESKIMILTK